jgi:outer membrane protein assembly factor BamB
MWMIVDEELMRRVRSALVVVCGLLVSAAGLGEDWPQFRGAQRDGISRETGLLRSWGEGGPKVLWSTAVCEGYAGAAIVSGRVYFNDYVPETREWLVRCLALEDGREIWRFAETKPGRGIRRNHGITRTVPAVDRGRVYSLDPKCVFHCIDAATGQELWQKNLVRDYGARIPPWYNGQNPLVDEGRVILGIGGDEVLMVAFEGATGKEVWRTPNADKWPLSHSSVMPAEICGVKQYLWCTLFGPVGVRASDGALLWHHDRQFNTAVSPSPLAIGDDRVFMTGPYEAGSVMFRVKQEGETFRTETVFDWSENEWNSEVHTPILHDGHMFAVGKKKRGLFRCMDLDGKMVWDSRGKATFGLGSFMYADGMFFVLEGKTGMLRLIEASTSGYQELASAQVLSGHDVWAPMALTDGKLVLRDMAKMVCIQVAGDVGATEGSP